MLLLQMRRRGWRGRGQGDVALMLHPSLPLLERPRTPHAGRGLLLLLLPAEVEVEVVVIVVHLAPLVRRLQLLVVVVVALVRRQLLLLLGHCARHCSCRVRASAQRRVSSSAGGGRGGAHIGAAHARRRADCVPHLRRRRSSLLLLLLLLLQGRRLAHLLPAQHCLALLARQSGHLAH